MNPVNISTAHRMKIFLQIISHLNIIAFQLRISMDTFDEITTWPEVPEPESPTSQVQPISKHSTPWQQLQVRQNERIVPVIYNRRIELIGKYYENVVGEIDWAFEGMTRCRVKGAPCYGREHSSLAKLKIHLDSKKHRVSDPQCYLHW
jgi:hypothetical protein